MWLPEATGLEFPLPGASSTWAGRSTSAEAVALLELCSWGAPRAGVTLELELPPSFSQPGFYFLFQGPRCFELHSLCLPRGSLSSRLTS